MFEVGYVGIKKHLIKVYIDNGEEHLSAAGGKRIILVKSKQS